MTLTVLKGLTKLTKQYTNLCKTYLTWLDGHCHQTQYVFQIRKCDDLACCTPKRKDESNLKWLPDPKLDDANPGHYCPFDKVYGTETDERDQPTLLTKEAQVTVQLGQRNKAAVSKVALNLFVQDFYIKYIMDFMARLNILLKLHTEVPTLRGKTCALLCCRFYLSRPSLKGISKLCCQCANPACLQRG